MLLPAFLSGRDFHPDDRLLDERGQYDAEQASDGLLDRLHTSIDALLLDLCGPKGEHPGLGGGNGEAANRR